MLNRNNKWYTLIEMLIAITIFIIMTVFTFSSYIHYQKKAILHDWIKDLSQSLYEARNFAINWLNSDSYNKTIWLYLEKNSNVIKYYSYDYTMSWSQIVLDDTRPWIELFKTKTLNDHFYIEDILNKDNWMFLFESISWKGEYFYFDSYWHRNPFSIDEIDIKVSYDHSSSSLLSKYVKFYTHTYITDY